MSQAHKAACQCSISHWESWGLRNSMARWMFPFHGLLAVHKVKRQPSMSWFTKRAAHIRVDFRAVWEVEGRATLRCQLNWFFPFMLWEKQQRVTGLLSLKANGGAEWAKDSREDSEYMWSVYMLVSCAFIIMFPLFPCFLLLLLSLVTSLLVSPPPTMLSWPRPQSKLTVITSILAVFFCARPWGIVQYNTEFLPQIKIHTTLSHYVTKEFSRHCVHQKSRMLICSPQFSASTLTLSYLGSR